MSKKRRKGFNPFLILIPIILLFLAYKFIKPIFFPDNAFLDAYKARYELDSDYVNRLDHINDNFVMDNHYLVGSKYLEKDFYQWNDITAMTFDKNLSLAVKEFLAKKNVSVDDVSMSIVTIKEGDKFSLNEKAQRTYPKLDKLLVNMSLFKLLDTKQASLDDNISVKESDLTESSVYMDETSVGITFEINQLLKLAFVNEDIPSRNMLKRYIADKSSTNYNDFLIKQFDINFADGKTASAEVINIARELNKNRNLYRDVMYSTNVGKEESSFSKLIVKEENQNYFNNSKDIFYDLGIIHGSTSYFYSIYTKGMEEKTINELGDLIDRKINEYYLLKNI